MSEPNVVAPNNSDCPGCGDVAEPRCIRDAKDCKTCCWCGRELLVPEPPPSVDSVKVERLAAVIAYLSAEVGQYSKPERAPSRIKRALELLTDLAEEARGAQGRAGGEEEQRWVRCDERMPEQKQVVALCGPRGRLDADELDRLRIGYWDDDQDGSKPYWCDHESWFGDVGDMTLVSHWMPLLPLPAPPSPTPGGEKEGANG